MACFSFFYANCICVQLFCYPQLFCMWHLRQHLNHKLTPCTLYGLWCHSPSVLLRLSQVSLEILVPSSLLFMQCSPASACARRPGYYVYVSVYCL